MKTLCSLKITALGVCLLAALFAAGCASTKVSNRHQLVTGKLPKPGNILVYNFVANLADMPADSPLAGEDLDTTAQTAEQIAEGKKLGSEIASNLVAQIKRMGMSAEVASSDAQPQFNDIVIRGYLLSVNEGSAVKRVAIGFGSGASELRTLVEGFQVTEQVQRKLGSGSVDAGGGKSPGAALGVVGFLATKNPAGLIIGGAMHIHGEQSGSSTIKGRAKATATEIADVLKKRFQEQGWIK